jgi:hypothetical protein
MAERLQRGEDPQLVTNKSRQVEVSFIFKNKTKMY